MVSSATDLIVEHSRRQLWVALILVVVLGTGVLATLAFPDKAGRTGGFYVMIFFPEFVAIALASLRRNKRKLVGVSAERMHAVVDDELRRHSLGMGWRNGFFVMLLAQPLLSLAVTWSGTPHPVALLSAATALAGVTTALASVLYYDR